MTTKQKIISGAVAVAVAASTITGSLLYNNTDTSTETTVQYEETIVEDVEEVTEEISETETETAEEAPSRSSSWSWGRVEEVTDPLEDYKITTENSGKTIALYKDVPFELQGEIFNSVSNYSGTTYDLTDISIMGNYIFVNTADGLRYLSDISDGTATDENITEAEFTGYNIFLNAYLDELTSFKPIKNFNGFFYGNDYILFLDNYLFENFSGELQRISVSSSAPIIKNSCGGKVRECEFYITGTADEMALIENATNTKIQNVMVEANISGRNVGGTFATASGECLIENCIVNGTLSGTNVGSFIGVLNNQIEFKNNVATTTVNCDIGYGGKAIGYVEYEYKDDIDKINGAYCETNLIVEGLPSERFIGNVEEAIPKIETIEIREYNDHTAPTEAAIANISDDGTVTTVYNLSLIDIEALERGYYISYEKKVVFDENTPKMTGYYDFKDIKALNQYATANELKNFYEENGYTYFESEDTSESDIYFSNLIYSNGDCVAFIQGGFDGGTLILVSYIDNKMHSYTAHEVNGAGTYFATIENREDVTDVKAFLWTTLKGMKPLCEAKSISLMMTGAEEIYE